MVPISRRPAATQGLCHMLSWPAAEKCFFFLLGTNLLHNAFFGNLSLLSNSNLLHELRWSLGEDGVRKREEDYGAERKESVRVSVSLSHRCWLCE